MSKYNVLSFAAMLFMCLSAACTARVEAVTPEQAVQEQIMRSAPETMLTFRVLGTRLSERGVVVLYSYFREQKEMVGYALATQTLTGTWEVTVASAGDARPSSPENLVDYRDGGGSGAFGRDAFSIVYGRTVGPEVEQVEVTFADGQVVRDETADGSFALVAPARTFGCELRVFGAKGQVLRRVALPGQLARDAKCPSGPQ